MVEEKFKNKDFWLVGFILGLTYFLFVSFFINQERELSAYFPKILIYLIPFFILWFAYLLIIQFFYKLKNKIPSWEKGGLITIGTYILILIPVVIKEKLYIPEAEIYSGLTMFFMDLVFYPFIILDFFSLEHPNSLGFGIILLLFYWFVIGAIIGFLSKRLYPKRED